MNWKIALAIPAILAALIGALYAFTGVKHPDRQEFQRLLTTHGGWFDIRWPEVYNSHDHAGVQAKHDINGETYRFLVTHKDGRKTQVSVYSGGKYGTFIWKDGEYFENVPRENRKRLELLAAQIRDAFCQGSD